MDIEQFKPNKPNFGLVVALSSVVMLVLLIVAYFVLHWGGRDLVPHHVAKHTTSELRMPAVNAVVVIPTHT